MSGEERGALSAIDILFCCCELFLTVASSDTLTLFPATIETLKDTSVLAILTFYRLVVTSRCLIGRT